MIKEPLYKKTVDILFDAYFNNTLLHSDCAACAVGNMIAANLNYKLVYVEGEPDTEDEGFIWECNGKHIKTEWGDLFLTVEGVQIIDARCFNLETKKQVLATGYDWHDLAKIEYAFETAEAGESPEDYMFNGLVAVLEVLKKIHEINDNEPEVTRFKNHYQSLLAI